MRDFFLLKIDELESKDLSQPSVARLANWNLLP